MEVRRKNGKGKPVSFGFWKTKNPKVYCGHQGGLRQQDIDLLIEHLQTGDRFMMFDQTEEADADATKKTPHISIRLYPTEPDTF